MALGPKPKDVEVLPNGTYEGPQNKYRMKILEKQSRAQEAEDKRRAARESLPQATKAGKPPREVSCLCIEPRSVEMLIFLIAVAVIGVNVFSLTLTHTNWITCTEHSPLAGKVGTELCDNGGGNGWLGYTRASSSSEKKFRWDQKKSLQGQTLKETPNRDTYLVMVFMAVSFCIAGMFELVRAIYIFMRYVGCLENEQGSGCPVFLIEYTTPLFLGAIEGLMVGLAVYFMLTKEHGGDFQYGFFLAFASVGLLLFQAILEFLRQLGVAARLPDQPEEEEEEDTDYVVTIPEKHTTFGAKVAAKRDATAPTAPPPPPGTRAAPVQQTIPFDQPSMRSRGLELGGMQYQDMPLDQTNLRAYDGAEDAAAEQKVPLTANPSDLIHTREIPAQDPPPAAYTAAHDTNHPDVAAPLNSQRTTDTQATAKVPDVLQRGMPEEAPLMEIADEREEDNEASGRNEGDVAGTVAGTVDAGEGVVEEAETSAQESSSRDEGAAGAEGTAAGVAAAAAVLAQGEPTTNPSTQRSSARSTQPYNSYQQSAAIAQKRSTQQAAQRAPDYAARQQAAAQQGVPNAYSQSQAAYAARQGSGPVQAPKGIGHQNSGVSNNNARHSSRMPSQYTPTPTSGRGGYPNASPSPTPSQSPYPPQTSPYAPNSSQQFHRQGSSYAPYYGPQSGMPPQQQMGRQGYGAYPQGYGSGQQINYSGPMNYSGPVQQGGYPGQGYPQAQRYY